MLLSLALGALLCFIQDFILIILVAYICVYYNISKERALKFLNIIRIPGLLLAIIINEYFGLPFISLPLYILLNILLVRE
jgi:hypothetical protein